MIVYEALVLGAFVRLCELYGPLPVHLTGVGSPKVQALMAQEQGFHGSNNHM